jgi:hypothetical protein
MIIRKVLFIQEIKSEWADVNFTAGLEVRTITPVLSVINNLFVEM